MGLWSAYFFAKFLLYAGGYIGFNPWLNGLFALFTALPPQNARQRFTKNLLAVPLGVVLLYHDSWLPPIERVLSQTQNLATFTAPYLLELLGRFVNWKVLLTLAAMLAIYTIARRKLRMSTFVFLGILVIIAIPQEGSLLQPAVATNVPAGPPGAAAPAATLDPRNMRREALDDLLTQFYAKEQSRQVHFPAVAPTDDPYDILVLHVCSLSWDDLQGVKRTDIPLLKRFDIVFSAFNSAASYSGPAAIRLLRGNCGATTHEQLYAAASRDCLVFDGLQDAGFEPRWLMNHDGKFGDFFADVRERGGFPATAEDVRGAAVAQYSFDGSPIYSDYSVLSRWWTGRLSNPASRVVLYYNSTSLHDGNRVGGKVVGAASSSFADRLDQLAGELNRFLDDLQRSGRRVIVVIVPEHGAAVRGDKRQIPGLREIPTPAITRVPVGVVLVNAVKPQNHVQQTIELPTSYLALSELLSRFVADSPFDEAAVNLANYTQNLPQTESVAENDGTVVMEVGGRYMMRTPDGDWSSWDTTRPAAQ